MNAPWRNGLLIPALALALPLAACRAEAEPEGELLAAYAPDSAVVDAAEVLAPDKESVLERQLHTLWSDTGTAMVVSTVESLDGNTVEAYARDQFQTWGIGSNATHRGLLILVAPAEQMARIEVGCGLETVITDAVAQRIMDEAVIPEFRDNDYADGIAAGVDALLLELDTSANEPGPVSPYCRSLMQEAA